MVNIQNLLRKNIKNLKPYSSARDDYSCESGIFLDANENSFGSVPSGEYNRYPDPLQKIIKEKLSTIKYVASKNIFIGNGSDEAIDLVIRAFCEPGKDRVLIMPPTYGMYKVTAAINNVNVIETPLSNEFQISEDLVLAALSENTKIIFICSPNNPSGNLLDKDSIKSIINSFKGLVVIDEAYIDFSCNISWINEIENFNNLIVLQTFSKAWGLAYIRVGMAYANEEIIDIFNSIKYPYNVNGVSQQMILKALDFESEKDFFVKKITRERKKLVKALDSLDCVISVYKSDSNFLLTKVTNASQIYNYLISKKIIVRNRSSLPHCENCLRFTIGTEEQNLQLIKALKEYGD